MNQARKRSESLDRLKQQLSQAQTDGDKKVLVEQLKAVIRLIETRK